MDSQTPAVGSQCDQERNGATLGPQVPGISHQPGREERSRAGEGGAIQKESSGAVAKLPESDQRRTAGQLARLGPRLVGILPTGGGTPEPLRTGRLAKATHPKLLLATRGQLARAAAQAAPTGTERTLIEGGAQFQRGVANRGQSEYADGVKQRSVATLWFLDAIGPCGHRVKGRCVQPPDAENRTSGGVGGCRGAIPGTRPDHWVAAPSRYAFAALRLCVDSELHSYGLVCHFLGQRLFHLCSSVSICGFLWVDVVEMRRIESLRSFALVRRGGCFHATAHALP